jgi:purine-binding chemotaxis protein CheW
MAGLFLIANISGSQVAIDANKVESVVRIGEIQSVPNCSPLVAGLYALRSRVLTIIDSQYLVTGVSKLVSPGSTAIVVSVAGHSYGLVVDSINDAISLGDVSYLDTVTLDSVWQQIASGVILHNDEMLMVVEIERLINAPDQMAA